MQCLNENEQYSFIEESEESEKTESNLFPETIKSEVNFLVLPFFSLYDADVKNRTKTEYRMKAKRGNEELEVVWLVASNPEYGYPGPFDRMLHKVIEQIISELQPPIQNPISIGSFYNLCRRMGIKKFGGTEYRRIKEAFERITSTSIKSEGAFYNKEKEEWIEDIFHLYDRVTFKGKRLPDGTIADTNYLYLNSWYLDNINAHYVKPIDWNYYKSLKTPIAQRLYEVLSVKFYGLYIKGGRFISYRYSNLCNLLPIIRQEYLSLAKRSLDSAHQRLKESKFLKKWEWEETDREERDWIIKYYPGQLIESEIRKSTIGKQLEFVLLSPKSMDKAREDKNDSNVKQSSIIEQLLKRGITKSTAKNLVESYSSEDINEHIRIFDWLKNNNSTLLSKNPAGFLRKAIEENYQPPKEYLDQLNRKDKEQKNQDRQERWLKHRVELIKQDIDNWDQIPLEKRIEGRLGFWITGQTMNGKKPTSEQIEAKKQELIDSLPKTYEGKSEYLSQNYPEIPPHDFE